MVQDFQSIITLRARIIKNIRRFFDERGYSEVDTPILAPQIIPESTIEVFRSDFVHPYLPPRDLYLLPSPEYWMKRLIAGGSGNIYQVCRSFRNAENLGPIHSPEFTMLEWYTIGADYLGSIDICEALVASLVSGENRPTGKTDRFAAISPPFERISMDEAFRKFAGIDLAAALESDGLEKACRDLGITTATEDRPQDWFNRIFVSRVEPNLPTGRPLVLYDYPACVPTTARTRNGTPWSERWELYLNGVEVANCFTEETDPVAIDDFVRSEAAEKGRALVPARPDMRFHELFFEGFPLCSGAALGVDRLIMALAGAPDIRGVILFPIHDTLR